MTKEKLSLAESLTFLDKKVMVTGAASGIGEAISQRFAEAGASVGFSTLTKRDYPKPLAA